MATIAEGNSSVVFQVTTTPVGANAGVVITATKSGVSRTAFIAVNAPTLETFSLGSSSVQGGTNGSLTVTLAGSAATGGYSISLLSGAPTLAVLPSSTSVPAGTSTRTLSFSTTLVAYRGSVVKTQTLTLTP
jgi:hypothetical protein